MYTLRFQYRVLLGPPALDTNKRLERRLAITGICQPAVQLKKLSVFNTIELYVLAEAMQVALE